MLVIYHNPRCKKSCEGLKYLQDNGVQHTIVKYLETGLTKEILKELAIKTSKKPQELLRTQEEYFKKELKGKKFTDDEWVKIIIENPKLLQRPIIVGKYKAVIAQPANLIDGIK